MKRIGGIQFMIGVAVGAAVFGGSIAYATGIMAQPKTAAVIIDGKAVDLKGYIIEGAHYFQLRDLDAALIPSGKDFSIVWDGANNQVLLDTSRGYAPDETLPALPPAFVQAQAPAATTAMTTDEMRAEIIRLTNIERVNAGLPELEVLPALMDCAQLKADDMKVNHYYGHTSPVYGTFGDMIKSFVPGARSAAENIAPWTRTPQEAFAGWVDSPEHLNHILAAKYTHIGVGVIEGADGGYWWVQQFVTL